MHQHIHTFYQTRAMQTTREFRLFLQFHERVEQMGFIPLASEKKVYDPKLNLTGVIDMLYVHKNNMRATTPRSSVESGLRQPRSEGEPLRVWLVDWKRSKDVKYEGYDGQCGFPPLDQLQDCNYEHWGMQQNLYKWLLEGSAHARNEQQGGGYLVVMMSVVVLHPEKQMFSIHHIPDRQDLVYKMLQTLETQA